MGKWLLSASLVFFGVALVATDADARRLGGGRSVGAQRSVTPPPAAAPARPAQQPQAAPQQQPSRWGALGGILGGLALGGLLGYLFGGSGLLGLLLIAALAVVIILAVRARRAQPARPVQLAGLGDETVGAPPPSPPASVSAPGTVSRAPAGFDTAGFLRTAKTNFIKLQLANDAGRLDEIREFTTRESASSTSGRRSRAR